MIRAKFCLVADTRYESGATLTRYYVAGGRHGGALFVQSTLTLADAHPFNTKAQADKFRRESLSKAWKTKRISDLLTPVK